MFKLAINEQTFEYQSLINQIDKNDSPFKEIINRENLTSICLFNDEKEYVLDQLLELKVNIKQIGSLYVFLETNNLDKKELFSQIKELKMVEVNDLESAKGKLDSLLSILNNQPVLLSIFDFYSNSYLDESIFQDSFNASCPFFYFKKEQCVENDVEIKEVSDEKKKEPLTFVNVLKESGRLLIRFKFHFLLLIVATLLFSVSIPLAVLNVFSNNLLYIFLIICAAIGIAMNAYCYFDHFKKNKFVSAMTFLSIITNVISIGISVGFCLAI